MIYKKGNYIHHISAGGFVYWKNKILLVKSYWHGGIIPPHGHQEPKEKLLDTAMREICEETGYCDLIPLEYLGPAQYSYNEGKVKHVKIEYRWLFTLKTPKRSKKQTEESELLENRWYSVDEALRVATFENTRVHLQKIKQYISQLNKSKKK